MDISKVPFMKVKASARQVCISCEKQIELGEIYYIQSDNTHIIVPKKFCIECYEKLMSLKRFF